MRFLSRYTLIGNHGSPPVLFLSTEYPFVRIAFNKQHSYKDIWSHEVLPFDR